MNKNQDARFYEIINAFYVHRPSENIPNTTIGRQGVGGRGYLTIDKRYDDGRYEGSLQIPQRGLGRLIIGPDGSIEVLVRESPKWFSPPIAREGLETLLDLK